MRDATIGRNYAAALYELGSKHDALESYARAFEVLDEVLAENPRIRQFLETPQIDPAVKQKAVRSALDGRVPDAFVRFVLVVIGKHRQRLLRVIRTEFEAILDEKADRVHAAITLAREPDETTVREIGDRLSEMLGKTVVPHVQVNPAIVGGIVVKYGDRVLDGSVRRQLLSLKREMMNAGLPHGAGAGQTGR